MKYPKFVREIAFWILILFTIYIIFELIRKILGGSLTSEALIISLLVFSVSHSIYMHNSLQKSINRIDKRLASHIAWHKGKSDT
ncbi:hypothetical protein ACFL0V_02670 [Nanoarchaeota archaeon]